MGAFTCEGWAAESSRNVLCWNSSIFGAIVIGIIICWCIIKLLNVFIELDMYVVIG